MTNIYVQGQLLDQYNDEVIEVTSSVLDVGDLTKNTGDFSKTFTIPASPNNNRLFKHWYNASIDNGFDARTKVEGHIDIDGVPFKTGKWRLSEVIFKDGVVDGYVINFFGNLPNVKDTLGDDLLSDINFVQHDHEWTGANVMEGLKGDLNSVSHTQRDVIYTPMSQKRYFYNKNAFSSPDIGESINIAGTGTGTGIEWYDLRPSIKAKTIIDNIQHKYGTGTKQVIDIIVTQTTTSTTGLSLTLNGIERSFSLSAGTASAVASSINTFVGVLFGSYVTCSVLGSVVTITSIEMEQELNPVFVIEDVASNLELDVSVSAVGAFPYENPIVFSDDFFGTTEFEQMYLWLKRDDDENIGLSEEVVKWNPASDMTGVDTETNIVTFTGNRPLGGTETYEEVIFYTQDVNNYEDIPFTIIVKTKITKPNGEITEGVREIDAQVGADGNVNEIRFVQNYRNIQDFGTTTFEVQYFVRTNTTFQVDVYLSRQQKQKLSITSPATDVGSPFLTFQSGVDPTISTINISRLMPDMKISEFLKGIFDMFKLVIVPQEDGSMYVNSLDSFYDQGNRYDISDKVDYSTFKVKRGELYQSIAYQFEDPSTILNEEFQNRARDKQSYGSSLVNIYESVRPIKLIDGEKVEIKLPFEQVIYERLTDTDAVAAAPELNISVATIADKDLKPVTPKPLLHYVSEQDISGCPIKFETDNNTTTTLNTTMLMPMSQFGTEDPASSLLFESEFSFWNGQQLSNNLYTIHHKDYIQAVFELKRRSFEYDALLPTQLVTRLGLNDVLTIEGIDYRINKFKHNLLEGTTKLELINGFDTTLYKGVYIPSQINMSKYKSTLYFNVPNIDNYTQTKIDTGDGTSWLTIGVLGLNNNMAQIRTNSINTTTFDRSCVVEYLSPAGDITYVNITQMNHG